MADFVECNFLIATDEVGLAKTPPPVRGSAEWLAALSETVSDELSESLVRQETAKKMGGAALLELDAVIGAMRSHTRSPQGTGPTGSVPVSVFKPSVLAAYGIKAMAEAESLAVAPLAAERSQVPERSQLPRLKSSETAMSVVDAVRASWPVNWSVLRGTDLQVPKLKVGGSNPSPSV